MTLQVKSRQDSFVQQTTQASAPRNKTGFWFGATVIVLGLIMTAAIYAIEYHSGIATNDDAVKTANYTPEQKAVIAFAGDYEDVLNNFLKDVQSSVRDYKAQRKILEELSDPFNMRDPAYAEENRAALKILAPELRGKMDAVFTVFTKTETNLHSVLQNRPASTRQAVLERWKKLKDKQLKLYVDYFTYEEKILQTYEDLLDFYVAHRSEMVVDSDFVSIDFADESLKNQQQNYLKAIETLQQQQSMQLKQASL